MKTLCSQLDPTLLARTQHYEKLTLLLRQHLPPECDGHYAVTGIQQQSLVIVADSPVWATRLRQLAPQIVTVAGRQLDRIQHVQIKSRLTAATQARPNIPTGIPTVKRQLSQRASQQIASAASSISDDALKKALLKLARHQQKSDADA